jgi:biuret amidohydrolase
VELSARDAADRGYLVMLVADGCSASTQAAHEDALARLSDGGFIAVKSTDEVIELLAAGSTASDTREVAAV